MNDWDRIVAKTIAVAEGMENVLGRDESDIAPINGRGAGI